ncbi:MAG: hypothetical protein ACYCWE_06530 [Eubacteriales bacterium]
MTHKQAGEIIAVIEENLATRDGTGSAGIGQQMGAGFGGMNGSG